MRFDHVAGFIVNANHRITSTGKKHKLQTKHQAEANGKFKLMAVDDEDFQSLWLENCTARRLKLANPFPPSRFGSRILDHQQCSVFRRCVAFRRVCQWLDVAVI
jgi:hypothetical protein